MSGAALFLDAFHVLRPGWLALLPVILALWWVVRRASRTRGPAAPGIAPHLRAALTVGQRKGARLTPIDGVAVVTATVDAVEIAVDGPPAVLADPAARRRLAVRVAAGLALLVLSGLVLRRLIPPVRRWRAARRAADRGSEAHAWHALERVIAGRDHAALHPALDTWAACAQGPDPRRDAAVQDALTAIGQARYGRVAVASTRPRQAWSDLAAALRATRRRATVAQSRSALPPLNPGATA